MENQTKICTKCKQELPLSEFKKHRKTVDGYTLICRNCKSVRGKKQSKAPEIDPNLVGFTPKQLIDELKARGYSGTLYYTPPVEVRKIIL